MADKPKNPYGSGDGESFGLTKGELKIAKKHKLSSSDRTKLKKALDELEREREGW